MAAQLQADASPEKRLFIDLLTRDISLVAAFLDLVDNSINAAVEPFSKQLKTASDYQKLLQNKALTPSVRIDLTVNSKKVEIRDTATGISATTARDHVFKFGRSVDQKNKTDRLSVYGIGLKRAMFKLGNTIAMQSEHTEGGFDLDLDVDKWARKVEAHWQMPITVRKAVSAKKTGTTIVVTNLFDEVKRRISDGVFEGQLIEAISRTYAFYLAKVVSITVNGKAVKGDTIEIGENREHKSFKYGDVTIAVAAGLGTPQDGKFRDRTSGWFVFCNGRAVVFADKSMLTGWGRPQALPIFQPKHRPFLGTVFFVSEDPEQLPWTTTKSAINEDSTLWQTARREMALVGRSVISFLDGRYTDEGVEVDAKELQQASGAKRISVVAAATGASRSFKPPKAAASKTVKVQYDAQVEHVKLIAKHLKRASMSASDVGRHTFNHFLRNEVGEE